jgi:hypothetical protein
VAFSAARRLIVAKIIGISMNGISMGYRLGSSMQEKIWKRKEIYHWGLSEHMTACR